MRRADVYWYQLDPTMGKEIQKMRPALVISHDDMNAHLPTVIIALLTSKRRSEAYRPEVTFQKREAHILLDQLRSVDKWRLSTRLGTIDEAKWHPILLEMLA
jgi:mRNA interferase MazF